MSHTITLIPGDGIGPEVTEAVLRILHVAGVAIDWDRQEAGIIAFERHKTALPVELLDSVKRTRVALKGPVTTPIGEGFTSVNVGLRKALDLFVNLRPVWSLPGVPTRYENVDLIIVRENTEDLYSGLEHEVVPGVVESLKIITEKASRRISEFAFAHARRLGRKKVTAVHKANIMKLSDGLFIRTSRDVAPDLHGHRVRGEDRRRRVHAAGDEAGAIRRAGDAEPVRRHRLGPVRGPGRRARRGPRRQPGLESAVFEAVHGSAPDIAGKNLANPTALLLSALLMLRHLGETAAADRIQRALDGVLAGGAVRTRDLGGSARTSEFTSAVCAAIEAGA